MDVQRDGQTVSDVKSIIVCAGQVTRVAFAEPVTRRPARSALKIEALGSLRHPSVVQAVTITPDSNKAFVALNDGSLLAYSLGTRKPVDEFHVFGGIFDMGLDARGDRLAVAGGDGYIRLLDAATLKEVKRRQFPKLPMRLAFGPGQSSLFVVMSDGHLLKLNESDLTTARDIEPTDDSGIAVLACSRDGTVATSHLKKKENREGSQIQEGTIKLWSADSLEPLKEWKVHGQVATSLAFDPSGKYLVSGGADSILKVWKLSDLSLAQESKDYHQLAITTIAFRPDGQMVTGGYDGLCQFWDSKSFKGIRSYPNYRGYVTASAISADGHWLIRGGSSLDFVPMERPEDFERVADYGGAIMGMALAPDRKRMATGGLDRRLILWEIGQEITSKTVPPLKDWITAVEFCHDGQAIAVGLGNGKIELFSAKTMQSTTSWVAHEGRVTGIATIGGSLVSLGDDGVVRVWSTEGKRLHSYEEKSPCRSVAVHGSRFAVGTANGTVSIYDVANDSSVKRLKGRPLSVTALAFAQGGKRLIVGYFDGGIESWDTQSWSVAQFQPGQGESVLSIDANLNNNLVAVGFRDGYARLYDAVTLREGASVQPWPAREIFAIRWLFEGHAFAIAGASNSVTLLRVKEDVVASTQNRP
jgi:WD40 repeat protein